MGKTSLSPGGFHPTKHSYCLFPLTQEFNSQIVQQGQSQPQAAFFSELHPFDSAVLPASAEELFAQVELEEQEGEDLELE